MIADEPLAERNLGGRPPVAQAKLDEFGLDAVCAAIANGESLTSISSRVGVSKGTFLTWANADFDRSARINDSRRVTSWHWDELAEEELRHAPPTSEGIAKARELASHFRWRASKIDIRYGDKTHLQNLDKHGNPADAGPIRVQVEMVGEVPAQRVEADSARVVREVPPHKVTFVG